MKNVECGMGGSRLTGSVAAAVCVALAAFGAGGDVARADRTIQPPLDMQLLEADCAVRARVTSIQTNRECW